MKPLYRSRLAWVLLTILGLGVAGVLALTIDDRAAVTQIITLLLAIVAPLASGAALALRHDDRRKWVHDELDRTNKADRRHAHELHPFEERPPSPPGAITFDALGWWIVILTICTLVVAVT